MRFYTRFVHFQIEGLSNDSPSLTQQQYRESQSIDCMIRRALSGDKSAIRVGQYIDVSNAPDSYADAQSRIALANTIWHDMDDKIKVTYGTPDALLRDIDNYLAMRDVNNRKVGNVVNPANSANPSTSVTADKAVASSTDATPKSYLT